MIYNFNLGIGWASSGVEYAQKYRNICFHKAGIPAKFIYTDMITNENIEHLTRHMGFQDSEVIWLYSYFTDYPIAPTTYSRVDFEKKIDRDFEYSRQGNKGRYIFSKNDFYSVYYVDDESECINRVEYVQSGVLIRKDYYTTGRLFSEYYIPKNGRACVCQRKFYNQDGTVSFEEIVEGKESLFRFHGGRLLSKQELVRRLCEDLKFTSEDTVILDRSSEIGQAVMESVHEAKLGVVIHAEHYSLNYASEDYILWNNYYEYPFSNHRFVDFYIVATDLQKQILEEQFEKFYHVKPVVYTIPVGNLDRLRYSWDRKPDSIISASRLAKEKHVDIAIKACIQAKAEVPKLTFDIYGEGPLKGELRKLIEENDASDYIRLMGQQDLEDVYEQYDLYLSASHSEGFGLSLMEALGSGNAIIGFDVLYGNRNFVSDSENGYLVPFNEEESEWKQIEMLKEAIVKYFKDSSREDFRNKSYEKARKYLTEEVSALWKNMVL